VNTGDEAKDDETAPEAATAKPRIGLVTDALGGDAPVTFIVEDSDPLPRLLVSACLFEPREGAGSAVADNGAAAS